MSDVKTVLITGASAGIGKSFAEVFYRNGFDLVLTARRTERLESVKEELIKSNVNNGKIILVDEKDNLIKKLGQKILNIELSETLEVIPKELNEFNLQLNNEKNTLTYIYDTKGTNTGITSLLSKIKNLGIQLKDISTEQSSLESIFLNLVKEAKNELVRS